MRKLLSPKRKIIQLCISLLVNASSILLMPLAARMAYGGNDWLQILVGSLFWLTAILAVIFGIVMGKAFNRYWTEYGSRRRQKRCGLLTFFSSRPAAVADVLLGLSLLLFLLLFLINAMDQYIAYVILFLLILSIEAHSLLNGEIMKTILAHEINDGGNNHE